jgi:hypothetical protein
MNSMSVYSTREPLHREYSMTLVANSYGPLTHSDENSTQHLADFSAYLREHYKLVTPDMLLDPSLCVVARTGETSRFSDVGTLMCSERSLFTTSKGYIGLGPGAVREGDQVCVLYGGIVPFVLRARDPWYHLIGEAYVHGLMRGEVIKEMQEGKLSEVTLEIG